MKKSREISQAKIDRFLSSANWAATLLTQLETREVNLAQVRRALRESRLSAQSLERNIVNAAS